MSSLRHSSMVSIVVALALSLSACGSSNTDTASPIEGKTVTATNKSYKICTGPDMQKETLIAFFDAREGDVIEFCEGTFNFTVGLIINAKRGIVVKGAGINKTILNFKNSSSAEGINASHSDGIVMQDFTVEDTPGNGIRVYRSKYVTLKGVRTRWHDAQGRNERDAGYTPQSITGAYGLYPVESRHVLMEDCESHGASDAGIYVGQTSDVIVRRCLATYNVAGYEFENTYRAVFENNVATKNTGGFLVFDLPGLSQYGEKNIVRNNESFNNNTENFAPVGNIVGLTPRGTGMLILATDQLEIYGNKIYDNDTTGIALVNFGLAEPGNTDMKYDFYPEGIHIHNNIFTNNGGNPQEPNPDRGEASALPLLLALKNGGKSAHIVWDGAVDTPSACEAPKDEDGVPLTQPNADSPREEGRLDERGRPHFQRTDPEPSCRYNAWKSSASAQSENRLCIEDNNQFSGTNVKTILVSQFLNAHLTSSEPQQLARDLLVPASNDLTPHRCKLPARAVPTLKLPFVPNAAAGDARPSAAEVARVCGATTAGKINFEAALKYNCPNLEQYGLFTDPKDPRKNPVGGGVLFELNTALFSDYTSKYRFLFMPTGTKAIYQDRANAPSGPPPQGANYGIEPGINNNGSVTATLIFPVGTIIAKTFTFKNGAAEDIVETRLLIKRQTTTGINWVGLPYVWETAADGTRTAVLRIEGATRDNRTYDYSDLGADGIAKTHSGTVAQYGIPPALNCLSCHAGDDREAGAAPIGPKVRNLNRDNTYGGVTINQLTHLQSQGLLNLPAGKTVDQLEKLPKWNVPATGDIHHRARAYLEVNCAHCHNPNGGASNSGLYLDSLRKVNVQYGICKKPVAAGRGSGGKLYDIIPGDAVGSILNFRLNSVDAGERMPPLARSVVHGEAANFLTSWINDTLPTPETENEEVCTGTFSGFPIPLTALPVAVPDLSALTSADQRSAAAAKGLQK